MKYKLADYAKAAAEYRNALKFLAKKTILVEFPYSNKKAYYSLAPLSNALHELGADLSVTLHEGKSQNLEILCNFWNAFRDMEEGIKTPEAAALGAFIAEAEKKAGKGKIRENMRPPDALISAEKECFVVETAAGLFPLEFKEKWFKERGKKGLMAAAKRIIVDGFALKKSEKFSVGFEIIPKKKDLELPLDDYLDNFAIAMAMVGEAKKRGTRVVMGAGTGRKSKLDPMNRIAEIKSIIAGCEHDRKVKEPVFQKYSALSGKTGTSACRRQGWA
ncbi:MAG: hypothetical protein NT067_06290 [Candidatus Diapherotrites archaeon]|nr:hypothetical protein [Candidatus Diapherotrites archaeon]